MSFPYPKYKDSGVDWIGYVPEHWETWKLSHAFSVISSGTTPKSDNREYYEDGTIPWVNTGDLNDGELLDCEKRVTARAIEDHSSLKVYPSGALVIAMYGATIGKLGLLRFQATVNQACCVFAGTSIIEPEFLFYWFLGLRQQLLSLATGGGQPNVSQDVLRTIRISCPSKGEQKLITRFLDRETAKIDALVAEQRRLIELLKEKRQAVISHAVTKGLDPNAKMKPSGIEWLGDVPLDWEVLPLKSLLSLKHGYPFDGDRFMPTGDYIVMTPGNFYEEGGFRAKSPEKYYQGEDFPPDFILSGGQLVVAMTEQAPGLLGSALFVPHESAYLHNQRLGLVQGLKAERLDVKFLFYLFNSSRYRAEVSVTSSGSKVKHTSPQKLLSVFVCVPPLGEQERIASKLDQVIARIESLKVEAEKSIVLLHERRTTLISAAVTGKIDVRHLASQEAA